MTFVDPGNGTYESALDLLVSSGQQKVLGGFQLTDPTVGSGDRCQTQSRPQIAGSVTHSGGT